MEIREIEIKEIDDFLNFFRKSVESQFDEYSKKSKNFFLRKDWTKQRIKNSIKSKTVVYLLAFNEGRIVGYLLGDQPFGGISNVMWLAVEDECQNRGIGKQLLNNFIFFSKRRKAHKVRLAVTNKENIGFYEKMGFNMQCFVKKDLFGLDTWWMYKDIQSPKW